MVRERPSGVSVIAILYVVGGVAQALSSLFGMALSIDAANYMAWLGIPSSFGSGITLFIIAMLFGIADIAIGIGLWQLREWARITTLVLAALGLLASLIMIVLALSVPSATAAAMWLIPAIVDGLIVWYLLQPNVVEAFGGIGDRYASVTPTVPERTPYIGRERTPAAPPAFPETDVVDKPFQPIAWLIVRKGPRVGQEFGLKRGTSLIGRHPSKCDIVLDDGTVGREHAKLRFEGGRFWIYDLGSKNGTYVNNHKVQKQMLMDGDQILLGETTLVFKEAR